MRVASRHFTPRAHKRPLSLLQQLAVADDLTQEAHCLHILRQLRQDIHAQFKPGQAMCLKHIIQDQHDVVCVLPTGGGKSALWQIMCKVGELHHEVNVIISPTRAVAKQIKKAICTNED